MIKKYFIYLILFFCFVSLSSAISAISTPSVCCEQTTSGGICINTDDSSQCDSAFSVVPTSCESTSYCKLGTCFESVEGTCIENVPQKVCQADGGVWSEKSANEIPQCQLGCCIIADQAAFVTMTRCKSLATFYGIEIDYRPDVASEVACIEMANAQDEGACVFFDGTSKTCKFETRKECGGTTSTISLNYSLETDTSQRRFYKNVLCSAEELATDCARQVSTGCYEGKVYWFDSCGNRENVYSIDSTASWNKGRVANPDAICPESGESKTCGNCDYLLGSRCSDWSSSFFGIGKPANVEHYCKSTKCIDRDGTPRMNGENWCVYDGEVGNAMDAVGSRHYREICVDGEVIVEACEDFRNQICIHSGITTTGGEYSVAACRVNRWQDCTAQKKKDDCENTDARDCIWVEQVEGVNFTRTDSTAQNGISNFTNPVSTATGNPSTGEQISSGISATSQAVNLASSLAGKVIQKIVGAGVGQWEQNSLNNDFRTNRTANESGLCVPMVSPGQKFWEQGDSQAICGQATASCQVTLKRTYKKDIITGKKELDKVEVVPANSSCLELTDEKKGTFIVRPEWAAKVNAVCSAIGDCGASENINGVFTDEGYEWKYKNQTYYFVQSDLGLITSTKLGQGTGAVVGYVINDKYKLNAEDYVYVK